MKEKKGGERGTCGLPGTLRTKLPQWLPPVSCSRLSFFGNCLRLAVVLYLDTSSAQPPDVLKPTGISPFSHSSGNFRPQTMARNTKGRLFQDREI
ncbi:hypothetical protein BaRGS_00000683 [Batillaria attramentaria]|uniref:Uncharacterized protein n=1 Tax=Batillaria attramentaria TaxID=370345 RepID=A0ABD0M883_9CAEN